MASAPDTSKQQKKAAAQTRADEQQRQANLSYGNNAINSAFSGYDDPYYDKLKSNYTDFYNPQLETKFSDAQQQALFNNARAGTINSSAAAKTNSDLQREKGTQEQSVLSGAESYANNARQQIASQKAQLQGALSASGGNYVDTGALSNIAPPTLPTLSPLGDIFSAVAGVASNDAAVRARAAGAASVLSPIQQQQQFATPSASKWVP